MQSMEASRSVGHDSASSSNGPAGSNGSRWFCRDCICWSERESQINKGGWSNFIKTIKDLWQGTIYINFWCSHFFRKLTLEANAMKYLWLWLLLVWYLAAIGTWCWVEPWRSFPDLLDFGDVDNVDASGTNISGSLCHQVWFQSVPVTWGMASVCHSFPRIVAAEVLSLFHHWLCSKWQDSRTATTWNFFAKVGHGMLSVFRLEIHYFRGRMYLCYAPSIPQ